MKRYAFIILCVACGVLAESPMPAAAADAPLGRLFFTPSQRSSLDIARTQRARATLSTEKTEEVATAAPAPQSITYDGSVRRSDGQSTVWINHRPVSDKESASGAVVVGKVRQDGSVSVQMPQSGRSVELKPGQSVELLSGAIEESYSRKPVTAPEEKPAAKPSAKGAPEAKAEKSAADAERARTAERDREDRERMVEESARTVRDAAAAKAAAPAGATEAPR
jgi:hypothetical protein